MQSIGRIAPCKWPDSHPAGLPDFLTDRWLFCLLACWLAGRPARWLADRVVSLAVGQMTDWVTNWPYDTHGTAGLPVVMLASPHCAPRFGERGFGRKAARRGLPDRG